MGSSLLGVYLHQLLYLDESTVLHLLSWFMIFSALITLFAMMVLRLRASYGRYSSQSLLFNYSVPSKAAWFLQELPSLLLPLAGLWQVGWDIATPNLVIVLMFTAHYLQRSLVYPLLIRGGKSTPVHLFLLGVLFCTWNGYIQGFFHAKYAIYAATHFWSFGNLFGLTIFIAGMAINCHSDHLLRNLRTSPKDTGYKIPRGGAFELVSGANFFGEIIEWFGYALCAQTLTAWAFCLFTIANTIPRAIEHHKWYQQKFDDYPKNRKAVIPYLI